MSWLENKEDHKEEIELAAQYAVWRVKINRVYYLAYIRKLITKISYHS